MYQNYIFDLYGTLVDINTDEWSNEFWEKICILFAKYNVDYTLEEIKETYGKFIDIEKAKVKKEHPTYTHIDIELLNVFENMAREKSVILNENDLRKIAHEFRTTSTKYIKLYDGVIDLLDSLKSQGKNIYLLSNAQECFTLNELEKLGLIKYFTKIYISSSCLCSKPDKNFYEILFKENNLKKSESIMIGNDYITDIGGAYGFGIDSLYIHQSISPEIRGELKSNYTIMDGDVYKIKKFILK